MKKTEDGARAVMAQKGLTPVEPYSGNNSPWQSECGNCGEITRPTLSSVRKTVRLGQPKCCDLCRRNGRIRLPEAVDALLLASGEPLVPIRHGCT